MRKLNRKTHRVSAQLAKEHPSAAFHDQNPSSKDTSHKFRNGLWNCQEKALFQKYIYIYGRNWKQIAKQISTRSAEQVRSHAQKYFHKKQKEQEHRKTLQLTNQQIKEHPQKMSLRRSGKSNEMFPPGPQQPKKKRILKTSKKMENKTRFSSRKGTSISLESKNYSPSIKNELHNHISQINQNSLPGLGRQALNVRGYFNQDDFNKLPQLAKIAFMYQLNGLTLPLQICQYNEAQQISGSENGDKNKQESTSHKDECIDSHEKQNINGKQNVIEGLNNTQQMQIPHSSFRPYDGHPTRYEVPRSNYEARASLPDQKILNTIILVYPPHEAYSSGVGSNVGDQMQAQ